MSESDQTRQAALDYHAFPKPGKLEIRATKPLANGRDLARAYSPGVAEACIEIQKDPATAALYTSRANLVAVVTNGTAVLGLGNIGALASKPVMEGKAVLFKKFADIDCFDIEVNEPDPEKLADIVCALEPSFGAINLEDIKAPDCFTVERICNERMNIPVFHDDQHGTAIVVGAAATNALFVAGKRFEDIKIVSTGGGAAGIACLNMLLKLGVKRENVWLCDIHGLVYEGREVDMNPIKSEFAQASELRTLDDVIHDADLFLGLSGPDVLTPEMVAKMAKRPIIFALANPNPEIMPDVARAVCPDAIIATGRSDFPNQVNNVLCFPFIFRGALDVGATTINDEMKIACIEGIAALARATTSAEAAAAYQGEQLTFGAEYLIPKPFDPRLVGIVSSAVARAAMETGVATRPIEDMDAYKAKLDSSVFKSALLMRPVFEAARAAPRRIVFAEGEDERVLRAAQADAGGNVRAADPDRSPRGDRAAHGAHRPHAQARRGRRCGQPGERSALPRLLGDLSQPDGAARRLARYRPRDHAHQHHRHRRRDGAPRRGRQPHLRHLRGNALAPQLHRAGSGARRTSRRMGRCR